MQLPQMYFQPEDNHGKRTVERKELEKKKINGVNTSELKITFLSNFLHFQRSLTRWRKIGGANCIPGQIKRKYKRSLYDSGGFCCYCFFFFFSLTSVLMHILFNRTVIS